VIYKSDAIQYLPHLAQYCFAGFGRLKSTSLQTAFNRTLGSFKHSFGSKRLDTSVLFLPIVGLLPFEDERVIGTMEMSRKSRKSLAGAVGLLSAKEPSCAIFRRDHRGLHLDRNSHGGPSMSITVSFASVVNQDRNRAPPMARPPYRCSIFRNRVPKMTISST
jgi:hypothetical protein